MFDRFNLSGFRRLASSADIRPDAGQSSRKAIRHRQSVGRRRRRLQIEHLETRLPLAAPTDLAAITGRVFADFSGDGFTPGEEVSGATLNLYRDNGDGVFNAANDTLVRGLTSGADGRYRFDGVTAGNYFVQQPAQTVGTRALAASTSPLIPIEAADVLGELFTVIDSFNTSPQTVFDDTNDGVPVTSSVLGPASDIIGGARDLLVSKTSVNGRVQLSVNDPLFPGFLSFDSIQTGQGRRVVQWDGPDGSALTLDDAGLGNADLTSGGTATGLRFDIGADSPSGSATVRIYTDDGVAGTATRFSTGVIQIPDTGGLASSQEFLPFASFTPTGGGGADFTRVGAIEFEITGAANVNGAANLVGAIGPTIRTADFSNFATADLRLAMTADNASPGVGQNVTFTLTVNNDGPDAASGVAVQNLLPAGMTYVSNTPSQGTFNPATGIWTVGTIANAGVSTLGIVATVKTAGALTNTAEISASDQFDPDSTPGNGVVGEDDLASVTIASLLADLSLTKTVSDTTPGPGDQVTFVVTVSNAGPSGATGVQVTDPLPAGLVLVNRTQSQGSFAAGIWTVGAIDNGANATMTTIARVETVGSYTNTAQVSASDQPDPNSTPGNSVATEDDQASVTITVVSADLSLTKTASNATPNVGTNVTFNVTVRNDGPNPTTGVTVLDRLPTGMSFVSASSNPAAPGGGYDPVTGIWTIGSLAVGAQTTLQLVATPNVAGPLTNTAEVATSDLADPDSTPGNNVPGEDDQASVTITAQQADLSLTKSVNNATPNFGQTAVFTITLSNAGPSTATGIQVRDQVPAGLTLQSATPSAGTYNPSTGVWDVATLASGANATLRLTTAVNTSTAVTNTAEVIAADQPDPNSTPGNNDPAEDDQASVTITVPSADLSLINLVDNAAPNVGETVRFTITISNSGPDGATGVAAIASLPAGLSFVSATPSQGIYAAGSGQWTVGTINAGAAPTMDLIARVDSIGDKSLRAAVISSDQFDPNSTPGNDVEAEDDQQTVVVTPQVIDLSLGMTVNQPRPLVGREVTFTLTLANAGPNTATGVAVRSPLPTGLTFVSANPSVGTYSSATGLWTLPSLAANANATLQLVATYDSPVVITKTAEVFSADQFDIDSTPGNGVPTEDDIATVVLEPATADLSMTHTVSDETPNLNTSVSFTATITNAGPDAATGVTVLYALPAGMALVSGTPSAGAFSAATGIWVIDNIAVGGTQTLQVVATPTTVGEKIVTAQVRTSDQFDPDSTPGNNVPGEDDQASVLVTPQLIDLSLTKTISTASPNVGQNVTYVLALRNEGPSTATGVRVRDLLNAGVQFISGTATSGNYDPATGNWTPGPLAAGATATLTIIAQVIQNGTFLNVAEVMAADQPDIDSTPGNGDPTEDDIAAVIFTTPVADLSLVSSVDNPTPDRNQNVTMTIVITNSGPDDATGIVVTNRIPSNFNFTGSSTTAGVFTSTAGTWVIPNLANGGSATLTITGRARDFTPITSTAEITRADQADPDSTPGNGDPTEDDFATLIITPNVIDLSVTGTIDNLAPVVGDVVTLTFTVTNSGPATATGVELRLNLPPNVSTVVSGTTQGVYNPATGLWILGAMANGQTETLTIELSVDAAGIKQVVFQVTAADQFDIDSTPNNDIASEDDQTSVAINAPRLLSKRLFLAR